MPRSPRKGRDARIRRELERLCEILQPSGERWRLVEGLIQRAAFLRVELEDLEVDLNANGSVEEYQASPNSLPMTRIRAAAQHYDKMVRAYTTVCKQLVELIPVQAGQASAKGALEEILERKAAAAGIRRVK